MAKKKEARVAAAASYADKPKRLSAQPAQMPTGPVIFGKSIMGEAVPIDDLDGETKNVVLSGEVGRFRTNVFKTGTMLLSFDLADDTNGISCKKFFKEKDKEIFESLEGKLKEGMPVKVRGSIRFDTFQNDYVLFTDSMVKMEKPVREDHAEVKRVELHAHTQMSMMESMT